MRILFLSDNFPPERNAPAARTLAHAKRWAAAGDDVTVVTCAPNFPEGKVYPGYRNRLRQTEVIDGVKVVRVWTFVTPNEGVIRRTLDYASFMASGTLAAIAEHRPDVVVATSPQFFTAIAGWLVATARRRPFVLEIRDLWPASIRAVGALRNERLLGLLERLELFLYRRAARIVTVTRAFRDDLVERGVAPDKIAIVRNGVDRDLFAPGARDEALAASLGLDGSFVVSYVGTHGMAHGLGVILGAAEILRDEPVRFFLLGSGAEKAALTRKAETRGLRNVTFLDPCPRSEVARYWSVSDATVVPLRADPLFRTTVPSKIFEAFAMGVPILLGVEGEAREIVMESGSGLTFAPEDARDLAGGIRRLMGDPGLRARLRTAALAAGERFSRDAVAAGMREVLGTARR